MPARGTSGRKGPDRRHKRSKPNKQKAARRAQQEKLALESLEQKRRPFEPLLQQVVAAVLHAEGPRPDPGVAPSAPFGGSPREENWLEVGCGLGQLRALLPSVRRGQVTHTDLSESLVRGLLAKYPEARAQAASVTQLPFETESVDAVLGLCVFDSFPEPVRAAREIRRVLRPTGRFIHFLDAATNIEPILSELVAAGQLPLPNFFADIALRRPDLVDIARVGHLVQPYHDVLSVPVSQFRTIGQMLLQTHHPLAEPFQRYLAVFSRQPFDALLAARAFVKLTSDPVAGRPMNQALMSLYTTLQQPPYSQHMPFELSSQSTLAHFQARLEHYFGRDFGYELRLSNIVYARAYEADEEEPLRARVRRVGIGQNSVDWPEPEGVPTSQLQPDLPSPDVSDVTPQTHVLREAAIYCLVAEKSAGPPVE